VPARSPAEPDGKVAAGYTRVSTGRQAREGYSLPEQRKQVEQRAEREGWHLPERLIFVEEGVSGARDDRPQLERLLGHLDEIDVLIIPSLSRLGRSNRHLFKLYEQLDAAGVDLVSIKEGFDATTSAGKALRGMLSVFAEFERDLIRERVKDTAGARVAEGKHNGKPPFGYDKVEGELIESKDEAKVVRRIFAERAQGTSVKQISRNLHADGVKTKRGGKWSSGTLNGQQARPGLLTNRVYLGEVRHGDDWVKAPHPPIVDVEIFDKVQALRESYRRQGNGDGRGRPTKGRHLFTHGLLRCGVCGSGMHPRKQGGYESYTCLRKSYAEGDEERCPTKTLPRAAVDEAVYEFFQSQILDIDGTLKHLQEQSGAAVSRARDLEDATAREVATLERQIEKAERDYLAADDDDAGKRFSKIAEKLEAQLPEARTRHSAATEQRELVEAAGELGDGEAAALRRLDGLRKAVAGDINDAEGIEAVRAALRIRFDHFVLHHTGAVEDAVIEPIDRPQEPIAYDVRGVAPEEPAGWQDDPNEHVLPSGPRKIPLEIAGNKESIGSPSR
jgi:site-specific DNA recombinase